MDMNNIREMGDAIGAAIQNVLGCYRLMTPDTNMQAIARKVSKKLAGKD